MDNNDDSNKDFLKDKDKFIYEYIAQGYQNYKFDSVRFQLYTAQRKKMIKILQKEEEDKTPYTPLIVSRKMYFKEGDKTTHYSKMGMANPKFKPNEYRRPTPLNPNKPNNQPPYERRKPMDEKHLPPPFAYEKQPESEPQPKDISYAPPPMPEEEPPVLHKAPAPMSMPIPRQEVYEEDSHAIGNVDDDGDGESNEADEIPF